MLNRLIMQATSPRLEFHSVFRFKVAVDGIAQAVFTEFKLPSLQVETTDVKEGGQNTYVHKLPKRVNVGTATLKHGLTTDLELLGWYLDVMRGDIQKAQRQVEVTMYDSESNPIVTWSFHGAYPTKWTGPTLKSDSSTVAIEEIELVHHGFVVQAYS